MGIVSALVSDIVEVIVISLLGVFYGAKYIKENWTKEDSVIVLKGIAYLLVGYATLVALFLL